MKIIKPGRPQKGWAAEYECCGAGHGGGGCSAELLVEQGDLFKLFKGPNWGGETPEAVPTFKCCACGVLNEILYFPGRPEELPTRAAWEKLQSATQPIRRSGET